MSVNPSSVEASYIKSFLELIETGEINPSALRLLDSLSSCKTLQEMFFDSGVEYDEANKWTLSNEVKDDIDLLYDVIYRNTDRTKLQDELATAYTPTVISEAEGLSKVNIGDSFVLEGEDFIRIKTSDSTSELMNISPKTYYSLFPPVERFSSSQQVLGDCYCIETFMSLYCDKNQRASVVKLFSEEIK